MEVKNEKGLLKEELLVDNRDRVAETAKNHKIKIVGGLIKELVKVVFVYV